MSYAAFKKTLLLSELEEILNRIDESFKIISKDVVNDYIIGISDGRSPCNKTICFVEKVSCIQAVKNVVYLTATELPNAINIITNDPRSLFIKFLNIIQKEKMLKALPESYQFSSIDESCEIFPNAIIEGNVVIGKGTIISAGCVVKSGTVIGDNCIVRENTVIGCDGIALYRNKQGEVLRFPHVSGVIIGDNVEIGANVVIVRGTLKPTTIESDTVIGNFCNIGHGVTIGKKVWLSVGSLVGGNTSINEMTTIGLGTRFKDNLKIGKQVSVGMGSVVTKNIENESSVFGNPAKKIRFLNTGPNR